MQNKSTPLLLLSLCMILLISACSPAWARIVPQGQIVYQSRYYDPFQLTFLNDETGVRQDVVIPNYFTVPAWSFDGDYLFGLTKYPKIQIDGYPAYWDLVNGKFAQCKTDLAPVEQIQDADNPDNPLEVVFSNGVQVILFDLGNCKVIRTLVDHGSQSEIKDYFLIAGFSYNRNEGTMIVGLADNYHNQEFKIVAHDLDTHKEVVLADGIDPSLSPNGQHIAYLGMDGALYLMKPDGSDQSILVDEPFWDTGHCFREVQPTWSPDSKWLVYHRCVGRTSPISNCTIYKVNIETGIEVKLAEGGVFPSWGNR
jgi:hypothetical protein